MYVFEINASLARPLTPVAKIQTQSNVIKILKAGHHLILSEQKGYLEFLDIATSKITHSHRFADLPYICDIVATADDTQYLMRACQGILKVTRNQVIKEYYHRISINSLCQVTGSIYLVGLGNPSQLIVWDEQTDQQLFKISDDRLY